MNQQNNTILVIDDSLTNVVLLQAVLNNKGYSIDTALNVKEAYELMTKRMPKLILLDLLMPKINGFEFLEKLKSDKKYNNIPVVVVSALTDEDTISKVYKMGAVNYIKKPVDLNYLLEVVKEYLTD